jgi:sugar lactone lactonase YvrE
MRRTLLAAALAVATMTAIAAGARGAEFPATIDLQNGWNPEGIAIAPGGTFYVGSINGVAPTGSTAGDIYRGDVKTGVGAPFIDAPAGRNAIGVEYDRGRLFVAGGPTGDGYVYDAGTGATLQTYNFADTPPGTFINDVVATRTAAYFTDSMRPVLYRVPLGPGGAPAASFETLPLSGDYVHGAGFNVNGIDATPNGKTLVIVQSSTGKLFAVDPQTGVADEIDLGGATLAGDGLLLDGPTLYVVVRSPDLTGIAAVRLAPDLGSGSIVSEIESADFAVPTTTDDFGNRLYVVNARFGTAVATTTEYWLTQVPKPPGA